MNGPNKSAWIPNPTEVTPFLKNKANGPPPPETKVGIAGPNKRLAVVEVAAPARAFIHPEEVAAIDITDQGEASVKGVNHLRESDWW